MPELGKKRKRKQEAEQKQEIKTGKVGVAQNPDNDVKNQKISEAWNKNFELYRKGEKS